MSALLSFPLIASAALLLAGCTMERKDNGTESAVPAATAATVQGGPMKAACVALALCVASAGAAAQYRNLAQAAKEYRDGRWSSAYGSFIVLANEGDAEAARIALHMYRHGRLLYNSPWDASEEDLAHWSKLAGVPYRPGEVERVASAAAAKTSPYRPRIARFIARPQPGKP